VVTVLIPVRDFHWPFLDEAMASLRDQSEPSWRALVLVEADRADTIGGAVAGHLDDDRATLLVNEGHGFAGALNTGMRRAVTPFVAILLGDDLWSPDAVAVLSRHVRQDPDADFFHSARRVIDDAGRPVSSIHAPPHDVALADFAETAPVKHLLCWRRELGLAVGGMDESLPPVGVDDFDFPWTMAEHGARFVAVDECLYIYRDHRMTFRLTTHQTRSAHVRALRRVFVKHGLTRRQARIRIRAARRSYLAQTLYRSEAERRLRELFGLGPSGGHRESYR
jgi:GT2 family glycosyltransferase